MPTLKFEIWSEEYADVSATQEIWVTWTKPTKILALRGS